MQSYDPGFWLNFGYFQLFLTPKSSKYKTKMRLIINHVNAWRHLSGFGWWFLLIWYRCEKFACNAHSSCPLFCFSSFLFIGTFYYSPYTFSVFSCYTWLVCVLWFWIFTFESLKNTWSKMMTTCYHYGISMLKQQKSFFVCPVDTTLWLFPVCPDVGDKLTNCHYWRQRVDP